MTVVTLTPSRNASTSLIEGTLEEVLSRQVCESSTKDGEAFVPAIFGEKRRANKNVTAVTALCLDFDKLIEAVAQPILDRFTSSGLEFYIYETYSHSPAKDSFCFRIVLPFTDPCPINSQAEWANTRRALLAHLGVTDADPACSDASRLYYLPRTPPDEEPRTCEHMDGARLDWRTFHTVSNQAPRPKAPDAPQRDSARSVDLSPILEGLKRPGGTLGVLCGRLARGEAVTPPPNLRPPGEPSRYVAWRTVTAHVANLLEGWESSEPIYEGIFRPAWAAEVADSPEDFTAWEVIETLFETARANAPEYKAQREARTEAARSALLQAAARVGRGSDDAEAALETGDAAEVDSEPVTADEADTEPDFRPDPDAWVDKLKVVQRKDGPQIKRCTENVAYILTECPKWKGALRFNVLTQTIEVVNGPFAKGICPLTDEIVTETTNWLSDGFDLAYTEQTVYAQLRMVARRNEYDPVAVYLRGTKWDGIERLEGMLTTYFGVEDTPWASTVGRRWMIAAVARALDPGCQVDTMLVFEGEEGKKKTTALKALAGGNECFGTLMHRIGDEQATYMIHSKWIVEFGELHAIKNASSAQQVKAFISNATDNYRPKYGRVSQDKTRRCVFVGTTNETEYLNGDGSGARRFWPVRAQNDADRQAIREDREQLWAEAVVCFARWQSEHVGDEYHPCQWWLSPEEEKEAKLEVEQRATADTVAEQIDFWVASQKSERRARGFTMRELIVEALQQGVDGIAKVRGLETRIGIALKRGKWIKRGRPPRHYPPDPVLQVVQNVGPKTVEPTRELHVPSATEENTDSPSSVLSALRNLTPGAFSGNQ